MSAKVFADTNVLLYLLSDDVVKKTRAKQLLGGHPVISLQVANEFSNVCLKKLKLTSEALLSALRIIEKYAVFVPFGLQTIHKAIALQSHYKLQYYDSLIIATALENDCNILYSEDMQHGIVINNQLKIINPFLA
jgi:predicted nucleic acid-binding protein